MKNLTFAIIALCACLSTTAVAQSLDARLAAKKLVEERLGQKSRIIKNADFIRPDAPVPARRSAVSDGRLAEMFADTTIMHERPAGKVYPYVMRDGHAFANTIYGLNAKTYQMQPGEMVEGDDGSIYLKNVMSELELVVGQPDYYLKLDKVDDTTYVARMPQAISYDYGRTRYACRLVYKPKPDKVGYSLDTLSTGEIATDVTFTYKDGVLRQQGGEYVVDEFGTMPTEIIGQIDSDGGWYAYGDAFMTFDPIEETPAQLPATATVDRFVLTYTMISWDGEQKVQQLVNVGRDGNDLYIQNPITGNPDSWIKGTVDGDKAVFANQYVGTWSMFNLNCWTKSATFVNVVDSTYGYPEYDRTYEYKDELVFDYDADAMSLACAPNEAMVIMGDTVSFFMADMGGMDLKRFADVAAKPATPEISYYSAYNPQWGSGFVSLTIPQVDTDGNIIDPAKLYYQMYFDGDAGQPFAVSSDFYASTLPENEGLTYFPCDYNDGYDVVGSSSMVTWYFYWTVNNRIGVQSFYEGGNTKTASDIAWIYPTDDGGYDVEIETGIRDVKSGAAAVKVTYYDLQGRMVARPSKGVFIRQTVDASGNVTADKVLFK